MFDLSAEVMSLPKDEKMKFAQGDHGKSFGCVSVHFHPYPSIPTQYRYKALGSNVISSSGIRDSYEDFNISQNDALSYPSITHRTYPTPINNHMESVVAPFILKSFEITKLLVDVFNEKLGLPPDELGKRHDMYELSGNEARFLRVPPNLPVDTTALGHHTDFGSLVHCLVYLHGDFTDIYNFSHFCTIDWGVFKYYLRGKRRGGT